MFFRKVKSNQHIEEKRVYLNLERIKTVANVSIFSNIILIVIGFLINAIFDNIEFGVNYILAYAFSTAFNIAVIFLAEYFIREYKKDKNYISNTALFDLLFYTYFYITTFIGVYVALINVKTYYQVLTVLIPVIAYSIFIVNKSKTFFYVNNVLFVIVIIIFYRNLPNILGFIGTLVNLTLINMFLLIGCHFIYSNFVHAENMQQHAEDDSLTDHLTKLQNRRGMNKYFIDQFLEDAENVHSLAVFMIDIDWFKKCNDTKGHIYGDMVLSNIGQILIGLQKDYDIDIFRYGGEEFIIFAKNLTKKIVDNIYSDFNKKLKNADIFFEDGIDERITCSIGISYAGGNVDAAKLINYITIADEALYDAKRAGRNCVRVRFADKIE